jgi:hypothetical protein
MEAWMNGFIHAWMIPPPVTGGRDHIFKIKSFAY